MEFQRNVTLALPTVRVTRRTPRKGAAVKGTKKATKFSKTWLDSLKPRPKRFDVLDPGGRGFGLRVAPSGKKSWVYLFRFEGKLRRMTLGEFPAVGLADAREQFQKAEKRRLDGLDPILEAKTAKLQRRRAQIEAERAEREADTIDQLVDLYLEKYAAGKASADAQRDMLYREVLGTFPLDKAIEAEKKPRHGRRPKPRSPIWTGRKAKDISSRDVKGLLDGIIQRGRPFLANRVRSTLVTMFVWAVESELLPASPCVNLRRRPKEPARDRVLSEGELRSLYHFLAAAENDPASLALLLVLLTAQRPGEVSGARWSEIDLETKWWTIPKERCKNRLKHRVPLSLAAVRILGKARFNGAGSRWVFPSPKKKDGPIDRDTLSAWVRRNLEAIGIEAFTPRDLRRSAATHMAGAGIELLHVSKILNHKVPGVTVKHYALHSFDPEKRTALEKWARILEGIAKKERSA